MRLSRSLTHSLSLAGWSFISAPPASAETLLNNSLQFDFGLFTAAITSSSPAAAETAGGDDRECVHADMPGWIGVRRALVLQSRGVFFSLSPSLSLSLGWPLQLTSNY